MAFLTINGIEIPVREGTLDETIREIGATTPAFDGTMRRTRQAVKHDLEFKTTPLEATEAYAWDSLIRGLGHHWSFDSSLYSSKGLGPDAGYVATQSGAGGKFTGRLSVTATTGTITFSNAWSGGAWTYMVWRFESGAWHHYTADSTGRKWLDGVRNDAAVTTWASLPSGTITLANTTGSAVLYDDLVVVPYLLPTTWPPIFGVAAVAFSDLSRLTLAGDALPEATSRTVQGDASATFVKAVIGGSFRTNGRVLSVKLTEY
jgi:hypothetical protein